MSNDEITFDDDVSADELSDDDDVQEPLEDDLFEDDEEPVDEDTLIVDDEDSDDDLDDSDSDDDDTEALDDLEAEELEMLTEDEASETIVVDEETELRDIRRAQIAMDASSAGGAAKDEFVCSSCFLVKKSSQLASRRKKICLDCAA